VLSVYLLYLTDCVGCIIGREGLHRNDGAGANASTDAETKMA
jgi:hypothetical protein